MSEERSATQAKLASREEFQFLTDLVLKHSTGEHTLVALQDVYSGTTRFANNQIVQNVNVRRVSLAVTVAFGQQHGTASTTDLTAGQLGLGGRPFFAHGPASPRITLTLRIRACEAACVIQPDWLGCPLPQVMKP